MSEHSTEELKRQLDAATSRRIAAERDEHRARRVYEDRLARDALAEFAARGIVPGAKVIAVNARWRGDAVTRTPATFLGVEVDYGRVRTILGGLKADGSPSRARRNINCSRIEPFTEAGA